MRRLAPLALAALATPAPAQTPRATENYAAPVKTFGRVSYDARSLMIDGKRLVVWSSEFHPFRLPSPDLWHDILQKMKASGFNTVALYFDWGYHSPKQGVYDFTGILAYLYEHEPDSRYIPYLDTWAEWLMAPDGLPKTEEGGFQHIVYNDENPSEMRDDTLMMSVLPLAKIGLLLGRPHYVEEAKRQFLVDIKYLFDRKTGLWFHGWDFNGRHNFAEALWARGDCWVTIAIPEIIEILDLPPGDAFRTFLIDTLAAQVKTLAETQDESGLWHTLVMDPTSYLEASATAGFAYAILKGVRKGYLPRHYEQVGIKAVQGVLANIDEAGELKQVSFGIAMGDTQQFYKDIALTSMPYGQSLAMVALGEFLRTYI